VQHNNVCAQPLADLCSSGRILPDRHQRQLDTSGQWRWAPEVRARATVKRLAALGHKQKNVGGLFFVRRMYDDCRLIENQSGNCCRPHISCCDQLSTLALIRWPSLVSFFVFCAIHNSSVQLPRPTLTISLKYNTASAILSTCRAHRP
jgi:hypothetical protein